MVKNKSIGAVVITLVLLAVVLFPAVAFALNESDLGIYYAENLGLGNRDPRDIAVSLIQVVLGFLAIIVVILILYAGFLWMTAAGNDDKISTAKKIINAGVVGLIVILAAWGIARFVVTTFLTATQ